MYRIAGILEGKFLTNLIAFCQNKPTHDVPFEAVLNGKWQCAQW